MRWNRARWATLSAALLLVGFLPAARAQDREAEDYADGYQDGTYARVQYLDNGATVERASSEPGLPPRETAGLNSPIFPGDTVFTDADQRVEIQLAGGSLVRMDRRAQLTFLALPDPYAEFADNTVLQLAEGAIRVATRLDDASEFRLDTPAASIYFLGDGDFRVEVAYDGTTVVSARRGVSEVVSQGGSVLVRGGTRTEVYAGSVPTDPSAFNTFVSDSFDRWVDQREDVYRVRDRYPGSDRDVYEALPYEVRPYYRELSYHGSWVHSDPYGYVWYPARRSASWRPYYDGYWSYGPRGYFWVSYEPWGWAPYHYGRWQWLASYGWCWVPGRVFGGAWVAWSWGSSYLGWAPLDYWGGPAYIGTAHYGYYDPLCWSFLRYDHIHYRHYHRYFVDYAAVRPHVRTAVVVTRPARVSPHRLARSAEWRERAVREVRESPRTRLAAVDRGERPGRSLREVDRRLVEDRAREVGVRRDAGRIGRADGTVRSRPGDSRAGGAPTARPALPSYPRRIGAQTPRDATRTGPRSGAPGTSRAQPPRAESRESGRTDDRVRDLYRRMATPRTTRDPGANANRPSAARPGERATSGAREGVRPRSSTTARPSPRPQSQRSDRPAARPRSEQEQRRDDGDRPSARSNDSRRPTFRSTGPGASSSRRSGVTRSAPRSTRVGTTGSRSGVVRGSSRTTPRSVGMREREPASRGTSARGGSTATRGGRFGSSPRASGSPGPSRSSSATRSRSTYGSSRQRATGSRPTAPRPSGARSGGSRPTSRPSGARSSGSRSTSRPSGARSGGSRPTSRPSGARSGGSRSGGSRSATSSRGSSRSSRGKGSKK